MSVVIEQRSINNGAPIVVGDKWGQAFVAPYSFRLMAVEFYVFRYSYAAAPVGNLTAELYAASPSPQPGGDGAVPVGSPLATSATINAAAIAPGSFGSPVVTAFDFSQSDAVLVAGQVYAVVLSTAGLSYSGGLNFYSRNAPPEDLNQDQNMVHYSGTWYPGDEFGSNDAAFAINSLPSLQSIGTAETFGTPVVQPGPTYIAVGSVSASESFDVSGPSVTYILSPGSITFAATVSTDTIFTSVIGSIGDIASAESVSTISFTTQFITGVTISSSESVSGIANVTLNFSTGTGPTSAEAVDSPTFIQSPPPPPPPTDWSAIGKEDEKVYIYKVYDRSGNYIGLWSDVKDRPQFTQQLYTPGTTMTVYLARSANTTREVRGRLLTEGGDPLTTEDGNRLVASYQTNNTVGEDTDVDLKYRVDVYVHYGEYGRLLTQAGEPITTEDGNYLLVASGAPMGARIFSGFILDYEADYSAEGSGVIVTLASNGYELSQEVVRSGETTTVEYTSTEIATVVKNVLDTNPGIMSYDSSTIATTGVSTTLKYQLNTKLEAIKSAYDQTPDGWYWYGNVAENLVYLRPQSTTAKHRFLLGKHITSIKVKRSIEGLVNKLYFVGGRTDPLDPVTTKYKKYQDTTSQTTWGVGLERITDRRYTVDASMQKRADKSINRYKSPVFTTEVTITSARYDLESIKLGDMVGFGNFGNYIDQQLLQIVSLSYSATSVTIQLGDLQDRQIDLLADVQDDLQNDQFEALPTLPS